MVEMKDETPAIKIDKNVPLPAAAVRIPKFPFAEMQVGDSFPVDLDCRARVANASSWFGMRHGVKFSIRKFEGKFRIWRIS
jgi:hypothetical protein